MSDDPVALITISSSDNEDVQKMREQAGSSKNMECNSHDGKTKKRRLPLKRVTAEKEIFSEFVEKYKSTTKDDLAEVEKISKKLWKRFDEATEDYIKSQSFMELLKRAMLKFDLMPYSQLKAVSDELHNNKKIQKAPKTPENFLPYTSSSTTKNSNDQEMDPKTLLHIQKLEKVLAKLNHRIQKLENAEVDLNSSDEENSAYIQVTRYKERFCQVFRKICELKKKDSHAERAFKKHIKFSGTDIPEVNRAIEKFYNAQREFPDYRDIFTVVKKANEVKELKLSYPDITLIAQKAFQELGKTLKKYRQWDDVEVLRSYISSDEDPASKDVELEKTLEENKKKYGNRIDEVIDKYAIMQDTENLEPTEVLSNSEDAEDDEKEEDAESDRTPSTILDSRSDFEESASEDDHKCCSEFRIVLTDVRYSPAWEKYVVQKQKVQSVDFSNESCSSQSNRKRSLESESEENDSSQDEDYYENPIPSTSKQFVPITTRNYKGVKRSRLEKGNGSDQDDDLNDRSAKVSSINTDEVKIDDSAFIVQKKTVDVKGREDIESSTSSASSPIRNRKDVENSSLTLSPVIKCDKQKETVDVGKRKNVENSSSSTSSPSCLINNNSEEKLREDSVDSEPSTIDDIIDVDNDDLETKTATDSEQETSDLQKRECVNNVDLDQNNFLCPNDTLPLDVVMDIDAPTTSKPNAEKNQSRTAKNNFNDEIVIVDENIESKSLSKVKGDIIDVEEISDSPDKPKKMVQKSLGPPVNLSQIIRSMNFGAAAIGKNRIAPSSSKQVTMGRNNLNQVHQVNKMKSSSQNFRLKSPSTLPTTSRTATNIPNMRPQSRSSYQFMNQRQHLNSNNRQMNSSMQRNMQNLQFYANNPNNLMKSGQAAMQRKHVSERTVQMFDSKTNKIVTRREITTVVQQSVTQIVSQNQRVRQMQQVRRQQVPMTKNSSSDDIITLD